MALKTNRKKCFIASVLIASLFLASLLVCYWAIGIDHIIFLAQFEAGWCRTIAAGLHCCILFVLIIVLSNICLEQIEAVSTCKSRELEKEPKYACKFNARSIALTSGLIFLAWTPTIVFFYPGVITTDGINQLYQFATPSPTWYSALGVYIDGEFIDHHPVFESLLYGGFVYGIGGLFHSHNVGLFAFALMQSALTAFSLGSSICYLEVLGIGRKLRIVALLFFCFVPLFPINSVAMLKDSLQAPLFLLFFIMYIETCRTKGDSLKSKGFLASFLLIVILCILSKKTAAFILIPSCILLAIALKSLRSLSIAFLSGLISFILLPALVFPLVGGVSPGGRQEMLALFFQQTATVVKTVPEDIPPEEMNDIKAVMDVENAVDKYDPNIADPAKNSFVRSSTNQDLVRYMITWLKQGIRHPDLYLKSVLNCTGSLYTPIEGTSFSASLAPKAIKNFQEKAKNKGFTFECNFHRSDLRTSMITELYKTWNNIVNSWPLLSLLLSKGLYGGWIPAFCFLVILLRNPKDLITLLPIILSSILLIVCPVDDTRYIFPQLYSVFLIVGIMLSTNTRKTLVHSNNDSKVDQHGATS